MRHIILLAIICCIPACLLFGQSTQYENQPIEKIEILVLPENAGFDPNAIKTRIKTREGDLFSQLEFDNDLKALAQDFDRIEPSLTSVNGKMTITLQLWTKPTIRSIIWQGNHKIDSPSLQKELAIASCSVFDRQAFNRAFHKVKAYYVKQGFFEAQLEYTAAIDPLTNEVDIEICICEGRAGKIKDIVFCNFTCEEEETILEMMITKKYNLFLSWFTNEGIYHEEMMQQDQFTILNYLQNEGYADAKVDIDVDEATQDNRIVVYITANKGPVYYFGDITFEGNHLFCDEDVLSHFLFCKGEPFSPEKVRLTIANLTNMYGRRGYIDALVDYDLQLSCDDHIYSVNMTIEEGEQFRVGLIKVFGNCSTQTNVILHETLLIPGELFNTDRLQRTEEKLRNIGFFSNVNVYAVKSEGPSSLGGCYRDVHIEVEETNTGHFGAFFGFSTTENVFGGFNITERNFNYQGLCSWWNEGYKALRGGGEYAHFTTTIGAKSRSYIFSWTKPFFMDTPWIVGFDIENSSNRYISKDYNIKTAGVTFHAGYQINPFVRLSWHYRLKHTGVKVGHNASPQLRLEARNSGLISATGFNLTYDSTDHPQKPCRGFKSRFEFEYAGLGGDFHFLGVAYLNSYYIPIDSKGVLKFRGDFRFLNPFGSEFLHRDGIKDFMMPLDERLFLGGDYTIRGYRSYKLGPKYPHGDPRGGLSMQLLSIEYSRPLWKNRADGFLFCDAGSLSLKRWYFGNLFTSVGFGARVKIFEGAPPLTVGMGFPLNPRTRGEVKKFFLMVGGKF